MKIMSHDRVRNFLRHFSDPDKLQSFCNRHKKFFRNRLPIHILSAVRKKSNSHYSEKADILIKTVTLQ